MLKEMTQRAIAVAGWKCMKLLMPVEKTKLPPMMEMMLRYGIATRLWSQARSIMADRKRNDEDKDAEGAVFLLGEQGERKE